MIYSKYNTFGFNLTIPFLLCSWLIIYLFLKVLINNLYCPTLIIQTPYTPETKLIYFNKSLVLFYKQNEIT